MLRLVGLLDIFQTHPRVFEITVRAQGNLDACQEVQIDQCGYDEQDELHLLAERLGLGSRGCLTVVLNNLVDLVVHLKEAATPHDLEEEIDHRMHLSDTDHVRAKTNNDLDKNFGREVAIDDVIKARFLRTVSLLVTNKQVCDAIKQEDDVKHQQVADGLAGEEGLRANDQRRIQDPSDEHNLSEVIPLHVPVTPRWDDEF